MLRAVLRLALREAKREESLSYYFDFIFLFFIFCKWSSFVKVIRIESPNSTLKWEAGIFKWCRQIKSFIRVLFLIRTPCLYISHAAFSSNEMWRGEASSLSFCEAFTTEGKVGDTASQTVHWKDHMVCLTRWPGPLCPSCLWHSLKTNCHGWLPPD